MSTGKNYIELNKSIKLSLEDILSNKQYYTEWELEFTSNIICYDRYTEKQEKYIKGIIDKKRIDPVTKKEIPFYYNTNWKLSDALVKEVGWIPARLFTVLFYINKVNKDLKKNHDPIFIACNELKLDKNVILNAIKLLISFGFIVGDSENPYKLDDDKIIQYIKEN